MRGELDEGSEDDPLVALKAWEKRTFQALQSLPSPDTPPACEWTQPASKILEKSESDLTMGMTEGGGGGAGLMMGAAVAVAAAGAAYYMYFM